MVGPRIVDALAICDQHSEYRAEFKQLVPIAIVAGDETGIAEADFGHQFLEAAALGAVGAGFTEIIVDDVHATVGPAQSDDCSCVLSWCCLTWLSDDCRT